MGGILPYNGILLIGLRNLSDSSLLLFSLVHLGVYGLLLYWLSGLIARLAKRLPGSGAWVAAAVVVLLLAGVGALPILGIARPYPVDQRLRYLWVRQAEVAGHRRAAPPPIRGGLKTGPIVRTIATYQPLFELPVPPDDHDRLPKLQSKGFYP